MAEGQRSSQKKLKYQFQKSKLYINSLTDEFKKQGGPISGILIESSGFKKEVGPNIQKRFDLRRRIRVT